MGRCVPPTIEVLSITKLSFKLIYYTVQFISSILSALLNISVHCCSQIYFTMHRCIYCPSCSARTVVCDQIANKSFVLLNASILGEYRKKSSLRSASQSQRQDSVTRGGGRGGINKFGGGPKTLTLRIQEC